MGVRTILEARRIVLMAWGQHKSEIVRAAIEGPVTPQVTASFLQEHDQVQFVVDRAAAGALTRFRTPWLLGALGDQGLEWDPAMMRRAIIWLSKLRKKAVLKLTDDDYNEAGLQDLLRIQGSAYEVNLAGFYQLQHTITGWPGGRDPRRTKPGDAPVRPLRSPSAGVFPKRILVLSPHPDDDVIGMGGTLCRLVEHGHEVHVAYQVSGANAVSDEALARALRFVRRLGPRNQARLRAPAVPVLAARDPGFASRDARDLPLEGRRPAPGGPRGRPGLRRRFRPPSFSGSALLPREPRDPEAAGGRRPVDHAGAPGGPEAPPHIRGGRPRRPPRHPPPVPPRAARRARKPRRRSPGSVRCELWLYRGAWSEWSADEIDLAVPLSPQEVLRRRRAIFCHETQKDMALFLGDDRREFWQRSEDRSRRLAETYNALGLAEYEAIEAFKRYAPGRIPSRSASLARRRRGPRAPAGGPLPLDVMPAPSSVSLSGGRMPAPGRLLVTAVGRLRRPSRRRHFTGRGAVAVAGRRRRESGPLQARHQPGAPGPPGPLGIRGRVVHGSRWTGARRP